MVLVGWGLVVICANNVGLFYGLFSSHMTAIRVFFMVFETKWSNWKIDVCAAGASLLVLPQSPKQNDKGGERERRPNSRSSCKSEKSVMND